MIDVVCGMQVQVWYELLADHLLLPPQPLKMGVIGDVALVAFLGLVAASHCTAPASLLLHLPFSRKHKRKHTRMHTRMHTHRWTRKTSCSPSTSCGTRAWQPCHRRSEGRCRRGPPAML